MARSECPACRLVFSTSAAFDKHRTGSFGEGVTDSKGVTRYKKHERSCLTVDAMVEKGMLQNEKGWWTTGEFDAAAKERMKGKSEEEEATTH